MQNCIEINSLSKNFENIVALDNMWDNLFVTDITTFNEYLGEHPEIDQQIEKSAAEYAKDHDNFIIDARLGWYAVPESFKVYLRVDIDEAAKRAFEDKKRKNTEI